MLEEDFRRQVNDYAELLGWATYHVSMSKRNIRGRWAKGFPDVVLVKGARCIAAEMKTKRRVTTPEQRDWLTRFMAVPGVEAVVWRPDALAAEPWPLVETTEGRGDLGAVGARLRGEV